MGQRNFFSKNTWSGFESMGSAWAFAPHLTPSVGPKRTGGAPKELGCATPVLSSPVCYFASFFCLVDPLCRNNYLCMFLVIFEEHFLCNFFFETEKLLKASRN
jgi:hypothetical protein